jgi:signal peptidase I
MKKSLRRLPECLVSIIFAVLLASTLIARPHVAGTSMEPQFSDGQQIVVERVTPRLPWLRPLQHDDIIVFQRNGHLAVKRIVAVGGDDITVKDEMLSVNGVGVAIYTDLTLGPDWGATLQPHTFYVLGDNQEDSHDSKEYGIVRLDEVDGRVVLTSSQHRARPALQINSP